MSKLTIKDFSKYLPHDIKARHQTKDIVDVLTFENIRFALSDNAKPIMRPLSQLVEEITHNGKTFVPIVELAKIANISINKKVLGFNGSYASALLTGGNDYFEIGIDGSDSLCFSVSSTLNYDIENQETLFQKLYEWHFWTGDQGYFDEGILIEKQ